MKRLVQKRVWVSGLLAFSLLLAGCGTTAGNANTPVSVNVIKAGKQNISGQVSLTGVLDAQDKSVLSAQLPGKVDYVGVKEGDKVKKGDVIASLGQKDLQVQLAQAQANAARSQATLDQAKIAYDNAQADYGRYQELYNSGAISLQQLQQITEKRDLAKSQYEAAQNSGMDAANQSIQAIQLNIDKMTIKSPIDGVVVTCNVSVGDNVNPGVPLATVVATGTLQLTGNISESVVNYLKVGQEADVATDNVPNQTFKGTITYISPVSIPTGQFFPVKVNVQNPDGLLKVGMTGNATIHVDGQTLLAVPNGAVVQRDGKDTVFVVKDGKAVKTTVKTGLKNDKQTSIILGLNEGDMVVTDGSLVPMDGVPVQANSQ